MRTRSRLLRTLSWAGLILVLLCALTFRVYEGRVCGTYQYNLFARQSQLGSRVVYDDDPAIDWYLLSEATLHTHLEASAYKNLEAGNCLEVSLWCLDIPFVTRNLNNRSFRCPIVLSISPR